MSDVGIFYRRLPSVEWLNFFVADAQTGLGPFLAAHLAASGWDPSKVGFALTVGGLVTVVLQTPAGAIIDASRNKRLLVAVNLIVLAFGAVLLMGGLKTTTVFTAQLLIGTSAAFLAPSIVAITLGLVGSEKFDYQFGRNQGFNSAGNVASALLIALVSYKFGYHAIFVTAALFTIPSLACLFSIDGNQIDYARARGSSSDGKDSKSEGIHELLKEHDLLFFLSAVFLFHLSNAAMLPQLGEMLSRGKPQEAAPLMSACIIVTQLVIACSAAWVGKRALEKGRKQLLVIGFGVLPIRGILYTLTRATSALIGIQLLDGIANSIFVIVSILVIKDLTEGTGRFNLASGALATTAGMGAALSNAMGGLLIQHCGYNMSFLGLAATGFVAVSLLYFKVPETLRARHPNTT
jgi:predicted MFS family arabinose efflux permease